MIGPSGGGKTTLLRCLSLLDLPDKGAIDFFGVISVAARGNGRVSVDTAAPELRGLDTEDVLVAVRRRIGLVFQSFNLWDERNVVDNLTLAPRVVLGHGRAAAVSKAETLADEFGLREKLYARAWTLSGGQRQRVAIMRALMMNPEIFLLDEITSALDPILTVDVMEAIRRLRERGMAMVLVTHHLEFASTLCDRIIFLAEGRIRQIATPEVLRAAPVDAEVRRFLEVLRAAH